MLSDTSSAHRAQPPTRSKPRWQPYPNSSSGSVLATCEINTPKPSVPPSPLPSATPLSNPPHFPKEFIPRDNGKQKYALGLIDQAIKTLFEIWRPEDIPCVFVGPTKSLASPSSSPSPSQPLVSTGMEMDSALLPLKNFVHEVLKRSRTSGSIMQTALCYLEAVRPKVPEILRDEKLGVRAYFMPESAILPATEAELQMDQKLSHLERSDPSIISDDLLKTIRLTDEDTVVESESCETSSIATVVHTSTSPLPSPLLCPRRTFLAALILASKFSQDKCYSNRAWAKLSGLPPREIGRCERALGQALDWRLWVGKRALMSAPAALSRAVVRTQSESCITTLSSLREPFLPPSDPKASVPQTCPNVEPPSAGTSGVWTGKGLRRCSTAPMENFTSSKLPLKHSISIVSHHKNMPWIQVPYASSDSSSASSPETPPLWSSPLTSGDRTIRLSDEDGIDSRLVFSAYSDSTSTFSPGTTESKLYCSNPVKTPLAESKLAAMQFQMSLAETISDSLWNSRLSMVAGSHLWHADGGHISLESAPVH